jgi:DNA-binding transcriptional regulator LsrR (DeoR family)
LALEGASFFRQILDRGEHKIIGVGHGRTLAAVVEQLPQTPTRDVQFVSLLGGLTRKFAANPFDVIHRLAERTGAEAYLLPVPVFANSVADRAVLMQQYGIADVFALARKASLLLVGIGQVSRDGFLVSSGMIKPDEVVELKRVGACADLLGHFFSADGTVLDTDLSARATSMSAADLRKHRIVAIAGDFHERGRSAQAPHCRNCRRTGQGGRTARRAAQRNTSRLDPRRSDRAGARDRQAGGNIRESKK